MHVIILSYLLVHKDIDSSIVRILCVYNEQLNRAPGVRRVINITPMCLYALAIT